MLKRHLSLIILFALCALVMTACGGAEKATNGNSNASGTDNSSKASTTTSPETASNKEPEKTAASADDKIGIPECDDYLAKYEACVSGKVPESARAQYKSSLEQMRKSWREMAADPKTKGGLAMACQAATTQGKQQFKMYGCDF